jgi:hypothetical protein
MRIIGPPSAINKDVTLLMNSWKNNGRISPLFLEEIFPFEWKWGLEYHIDPVGLIAQSYKETGGGKFRGRIPVEFYNPCGLKIRHMGVLSGTGGDMPLAHQMFPNWDVGCLAHVQHVAAYASWVPNELGVPLVDPRYSYVAEDMLKLEDWAELGGRWAPSPTYGSEIETLMKEIQTGLA